jgi:hypothetical protein
MKAECRSKIIEYERNQKNKPLSFLGVNKQNLNNLAF